MNNKGFTLVELLATIVILGLVMGIASYGVISAINSSKKKSEEVFVQNFVNAIDSYLSFKSSTMKERKYKSEQTGDEQPNEQVVNGATIVELEPFTFDELIEGNFIEKDKFVNPKNKENCYSEDFKIQAFRDKDKYVYYYAADFTKLSCHITVDNEFINKYSSNLSMEARSLFDISYAIATDSNNSGSSGSTSSDSSSSDSSSSDSTSSDSTSSDSTSSDSSSSGSGSSGSGSSGSGSSGSGSSDIENSGMLKVSQLSLGTYVKYTPSSTSYTTDNSKTGYSYRQTINPSELNVWRVLSINGNGTVDIISEYVSSNDVIFSGQTGYQNLVGYLNVLASQYKNSTYTVGSRYFGFNGQTEYITDTSKFVNPAPWTCSTGGSCHPVESQGGGDNLYTADYNLVNTVLGTRVAYSVGTSTAREYWMASRRYYYKSATSYSWNNRYVSAMGISDDYMMYNYFNAKFNKIQASYALRPIVTLKANLSCSSGNGSSSNPCKLN